MILAEKIINERKKNGWSQEELADKLGVSRQSVSKWEGAQSVPDLQRILEMSKVFGVSTDYLLKDDIENVIPMEDDESVEPSKKLSLEQANSYLETVKNSAAKIAFGSSLCTISPAPLILIYAAYEADIFKISEDAASGIGAAILLLIIAVSLIFIIPAGMALNKWKWLEKEAFETEYGVDGAVRSRLEKFEPRFVSSITTGIILILLGVIAVVSCAAINIDNDALLEAAVAGLLIFASLGVNTIVKAGMLKDSFNKVLQTEDYTIDRKNNKVLQTVAPAYWLLVTAGYLGWSFITNNWQFTWIVWPIAGVVYGAISAVLSNIGKK